MWSSAFHFVVPGSLGWGKPQIHLDLSKSDWHASCVRKQSSFCEHSQRTSSFTFAENDLAVCLRHSFTSRSSIYKGLPLTKNVSDWEITGN